MENTKTEKKLFERTWFKLVFSVLMLALSTVLSFIVMYKTNAGASVTAFSLLPIILVAYIYGVKWGLLTGTVYGLIRLALDFETLGGLSTEALIGVIALNFILAYAVTAFGGAFKKVLKNHGAAFPCGALLCYVLSFLCHFISDAVFIGDISGNPASAVREAFSSNVATMGVEIVVLIIAAAILAGSYGLINLSKKNVFAIGVHLSPRR